MSPTSHTAGQHKRLELLVEEDGVTIVPAAIRVSSAAISAPANLSQTCPALPNSFSLALKCRVLSLWHPGTCPACIMTPLPESYPLLSR